MLLLCGTSESNFWGIERDITRAFAPQFERVKETRFYAQHKQLKKEQLKRDDVLFLKGRLLSAEKANGRERDQEPALFIKRR